MAARYDYNALGLGLRLSCSVGKAPTLGPLHEGHWRTSGRCRMFCDPVEVLRQRIHLVIEGAIGKLRRFLDKLMVPHRALRQLNQAATYGAAMFPQALHLITDRRDRDQV